MLLVQISDLHLRDDAGAPRHDPARALLRAFAMIRAMRPQPDLILLTGDVIDRSARGYGTAVKLLAQSPVPLLPLSGNHDRSDEFRRALGHMAAFAPDHESFVHPVGAGTLIGLDSNAPGGRAGVDDRRLRWLRDVLAQQAGPVLLAMHHPPFATGIPRLDMARFDGAGALEEMLRGSAVTRLVAGHAHREIFTSWAGILASTAPPLSHANALSLVEGAPHAHSAEPPGLHLHMMEAAGTVLTHMLSLAEGTPPQSFNGALDAAARADLIAP